MRTSNEDNASLTSFLDYTCEWTRIVNRGGLYEVNDDVYLLVKEIEAIMQVELTDLLKQSTPISGGSSKETIIDLVLQNTNIQFYWSIVNVNIQNDEYRAKNC